MTSSELVVAFAVMAFATHARAARDDMKDLAREFEALAAGTSIATPETDTLRSFILQSKTR